MILCEGIGAKLEKDGCPVCHQRVSQRAGVIGPHKREALEPMVKILTTPCAACDAPIYDSDHYLCENCRA